MTTSTPGYPTSGDTIAGSFVGQDYRYRSYFSQTMARGAGAQFALGSMTLRPGLYLSQRVETGGRAGAWGRGGQG